MTRKRKPAALLRAAGGHQELLAQVATEYGVEPGSDQADHIATLIVLRKAIRDRAWRGDPVRTDPDDLSKIDEVLKSYRPVDNGLQVTVSFVESAIGIGFVTCSQCGHREQHNFEPGALTPLPPKPEPEPVAIVEAPSPAPPKDNVVELDTSRLHYGGEVGGSISPMSVNGGTYAPRHGGYSAFDDPNPTRRL